jgi:hypothetical protein
MRLTRRAIASRANGALSRGPKTERGKQRSSRNALAHGLLAKCVLIPGESQEVFDLLLHEHLAKLDPADGPEHSAVEDMAASIWRQRRLLAIETRLFAQAMARRTEESYLDRLAGAFSDLCRRPELNLIHRYESRLQRLHERALQNLFLLSDSEPDQPPQDPPACSPELIYQTNLDSANPSQIIGLKVQSSGRRDPVSTPNSTAPQEKPAG